MLGMVPLTVLGMDPLTVLGMDPLTVLGVGLLPCWWASYRAGGPPTVIGRNQQFMAGINRL